MLTPDGSRSLGVSHESDLVLTVAINVRRNRASDGFGVGTFQQPDTARAGLKSQKTSQK